MKKDDSIPKTGFPKYSRDEIVSFEDKDTMYEGRILVVNGNGIFGMEDQPYYDIVLENGDPMLFKNIPESAIKAKKY